MKRPFLLMKRGKQFYFKLPSEKTYHSTGKTSRGAAEQFVLEEKLGQPRAEKPLLGLKLKEYALKAFESYVEQRAAANDPLGDRFIEASKSYLTRFIIPDPIAERRITEITLGDFEDYQTRLLKKLKDRNTTAKRSLEVFRLIMRRAYKRQEIKWNPTDGAIMVKVKKKERTIYSAEELDKLFPKEAWQSRDFTPWSGPEDYTAFIVAAATGMRKSEVLALKWSAIDLDNGTIKIVGSLKDNGEIGETKAKRPRATPIFDYVIWPDRRAVVALENLKKLQASKLKGRSDEVALRKRLEDHPVFGYADGSLRRGTWWQKHLTSALRKAGIQRDKGDGTMKLDAHSFRHTLASYLKARGLGSDLIREFCGWSSASIQGNYTHLDKPEMLAEIMNQIAKAKSGS